MVDEVNIFDPVTKMVHKPLRFALYAPLPKWGKSYLSQLFVKNFDGMIFDFAKVDRVLAPKVAGGPRPRYEIAEGEVNVGDAYPAFAELGLNFENQYRYIKSWEDFLFAIEEAKMYRDGSKKKNKRIWVIVDDTTNMRWQNVEWVLQQTHHQSPSNADWTMSNLEMLCAFSRIEANYNTIYVNQSKEEYTKGSNGEKDVASGNMIGDFYPKNLGHIVDATLRYDVKIGEDGSESPIMKVDSIRNMWRFSKTKKIDDIVFETVDETTPAVILKALGYEEDLW